MNEIVVSFCISSYCRYEILEELVLEILSVKSDKLDVVICDDCSNDGTVEKLSRIKDKRLKIYINKENVGGPLNICQSLDCGDGRFLFFMNERDNINPLKIERLISILEHLEEQNVAFAQCSFITNSPFDYEIYEKGKKALLGFACRIVHPTGYIFRRDVWHMVSKRRLFFEKECYGDYGLTLVSAIASRRYNGAWIFGDICDIKRKRIDFNKEKSGYYRRKKDQRIWYLPGVQWRELMVAYHFLNMLRVEADVIDEILHLRYKEYLERLVIQYKDILADDANTSHYNLKPCKNTGVIAIKSIINGWYLLSKMTKFCFRYKRQELYRLVKTDTIQVYKAYFHL